MRDTSDWVYRPLKPGPGVVVDVPIDPEAKCGHVEVIDGHEVRCNRPVKSGHIGCDFHGLAMKSCAEYIRRHHQKIKARAKARKAIREMMRQRFESGQA
jgi:hypothetical protein